MAVRRVSPALVLLAASAVVAACTSAFKPPASVPMPVPPPGFAPMLRPALPVPSAAQIARVEAENRPLVPLFAALEAIDTGKAVRPVEIIQLGDSHTANDSFSAQLRRRFQARFGDAGRGLLPAGIPFKYFQPEGAQVTLAESWRQLAWFNPPSAGPFGISGVRIETSQPGARMDLTATNNETIGQAMVEIVRQPGGGTLELETDSGAAFPLSTASPPGENAPPSGEIQWVTVPKETRRMDLVAKGDGPVAILSWGYERLGPGIVYQNHGTIGATQEVLALLDPTTLRHEMAALEPALILIVFGTNEGFRTHVDAASYGAGFAQRIRAVRLAAPNAAILVVGPPDAARLTSQPDGIVCSAPVKDPAAAKAGKLPARLPQWRTPPMLAVVREAQRVVAAREGAYFWDWQNAMGGDCSMTRFVAEAKGMADHIHMRSAGYHEGADALFDLLMRDYGRFRDLDADKVTER